MASELEKQMKALQNGTDTLAAAPSSEAERKFREQRGIPQKDEPAAAKPQEPAAAPATQVSAQAETVHEAEVVSKHAPVPAAQPKPSPTLEDVLKIAATVAPVVKTLVSALKEGHAENVTDKKKKEKKKEEERDTVEAAAQYNTAQAEPETPKVAEKPTIEAQAEVKATKPEPAKAAETPVEEAEAKLSTAAARLNSRANKFFGTEEEDTPSDDPKKKKLIGGAGKKAINFLAGATAVGGVGAAVAALGVGGALSAAATVAWPVAVVAAGAAAVVGAVALTSHVAGIAVDIGTSLVKGIDKGLQKISEGISTVGAIGNFLLEKAGVSEDHGLRKVAQAVDKWGEKRGEDLEKLGKMIDKGHKGADLLHKGGRYLNTTIGTAASAAGSALTFDAVGATEKLMNHGNKWDAQETAREEAIAKAKEKPKVAAAAAKPATEKTVFTDKEEGKLAAEVDKLKIKSEPLAAKPKKEPILTSPLDTSDGVRVDDATGKATTVGKLAVDASALEPHQKEDPVGGIPPAGERTVKGIHTARLLGVNSPAPDVHEPGRGYN